MTRPKTEVAQQRCRWREMALIYWLLCCVINSRLSLFACLEKWGETSKALRESPRKRGYQQDELWGERFG